MGSRVQFQAGASRDSMAQWQDCRPECREAWGQEFNSRLGQVETQWLSGKIAGLSAGRHGVKSSIPGWGESRLNGSVARLPA